MTDRLDEIKAALALDDGPPQSPWSPHDGHLVSLIGTIESVPPAGAWLRWLVAEVERLRQRVADDRAVCLCGCPPSDHESYGEDGESCKVEDHDCLRVCAGAADAVAALRSRATAQGMYAAWDEATADAVVFRCERDAARADLAALRGILSTAHGALTDAGTVAVPGTLDQPLAPAIRAIVAELEQARADLMGERDAYSLLADDLAALRQRHATAEAAYQEAQITIAGLTAERDAARVSLANVQAENANDAGLLEVIERQGVEAAAMQQRYNEVVEQRDWARYKLDKLRHAEEAEQLRVQEAYIVALREETKELRQRPCPCCGACPEDYPEAKAVLEQTP